MEQYNSSNQTAPPPILNLDRPKPCNLEAETAVLGALMLDPDASEQTIGRLNFPGAFFRPAHQTIFEAMTELCKNKSKAAVDPIVLSDYLEQCGRLDEAGGRGYILQLMDSQVTTANLEYYVDIVWQNAVLRKIITACTDTIGKCYEYQDDISSLLDNIEQQIFEITGMGEQKKLLTVNRLISDAIKYLDSLSKGNEDVLGIRTGFDFDRMITGLRPGELFVLAARPSIGKTALALNMASNIALSNRDKPTPVGIFSLEMPAIQLVIRMLCSLTRIGLNEFRYKQVQGAQWQNVMAAADALKNSKIIIDETGAIDILELRAKARRMKSEHDVQVIFIDYLQLIKGHTNKNASRENEVAMISGSLKALAKELSIPVVVLAQLNRQAEQGEKPKLSNLRESGAIEQDADVVAILHRDRDKQYDQKEDDGKPLPAELIIAKNRNGSTGTQDLLFFPKITKFENPAPPSEAEA